MGRKRPDPGNLAGEPRLAPRRNDSEPSFGIHQHEAKSPLAPPFQRIARGRAASFSHGDSVPPLPNPYVKSPDPWPATLVAQYDEYHRLTKYNDDTRLCLSRQKNKPNELKARYFWTLCKQLSWTRHLKALVKEERALRTDLLHRYPYCYKSADKWKTHWVKIFILCCEARALARGENDIRADLNRRISLKARHRAKAAASFCLLVLVSCVAGLFNLTSWFSDHLWLMFGFLSLPCILVLLDTLVLRFQWFCLTLVAHDFFLYLGPR